jgi:proline iminopeptidase
MRFIHSLMAIGRPLAVVSGVLALVACAGARKDSSPAPVPGGGLATGEHHVVVDGVRFWYRVAGTGPAGAPPVVYLHGGPGYNSHSFAVLAGPGLERVARMVYFDQRGSGRTERPWTGEYSIPRLVDDIEGLRQALGAPSIVLMGHSFGGLLALEYAAKHPDRVARLVLVSAASDLPAACGARVEYLARHYPAELARKRADTTGRGGRAADPCDLAFNTLSGETHQRVNDAVMFPDLRLDAVNDSVDAAGGLRNTGELGGTLFGSGLTSYRFTGHSRVRAPALVIAGGQDFAIGLEPQRALARALSKARIVEYPAAGHFLYLDAPERFVRDVDAFLREGPIAR